jgi:hypothetical protein
VSKTWKKKPYKPPSDIGDKNFVKFEIDKHVFTKHTMMKVAIFELNCRANYVAKPPALIAQPPPMSTTQSHEAFVWNSLDTAVTTAWFCWMPMKGVGICNDLAHIIEMVESNGYSRSEKFYE